MTATAAPSSIERFCALWADSFSRVLGSLGISSPSADRTDPVSVPAPTPEEFEQLVCIRFSCGGALSGELLWVAEKAAALALAQSKKNETSDPAAESSESQRKEFVELLRQVAVRTAAAWKTEYGTDIEFVFQTAVESAPVTAQSITVKLSGEKFPEVALRLFLNEELSTALAALPAPVASRKPDAVAPRQQAADAAASQMPEKSAASSSAPRTSPLPVNLGLVLDVELEATIRFGERQMLLREIFGLMAGAVVELEQMVNEPAELLVAGRLVARGEVVVVDGNFGLRVTEVASVNERVAAIQLGREG